MIDLMSDRFISGLIFAIQLFRQINLAIFIQLSEFSTLITDNTNSVPHIIIMIANFIRNSSGLSRLHPALFFRFSSDAGAGNNVEITKQNAQLIIDKWVKENKVVLFMKGTPLAPLCGYSNFVVELLKKYGLTEYKAINVLDNPVVREEVKIYGNWPTYPQLYIDGELVGGSNILQEMHKDQSLQALLSSKGLI